MKIKKINYKIICDINGCGKLAEFYVNNGADGGGLNLCINCANALYKELTKVLKGNQNAEKK